jgi:hypothetical protein
MLIGVADRERYSLLAQLPAAIEALISFFTEEEYVL